ncbi:FAD/NAD(P)-binding protein [Amaricoccus solimangrovi]|uniref:FAD-dependent oxidoreductase n=1 Tax=Amaricoccus solimangrovi TaxID=2589815 RepID=A0A501WHR7_9RHOB|nr:FAD/NAD(P)-binding protein [Amaricoccus solimangrovi]TPE46631.1 FAD-dependent oxidoreductase [Amaricoccus solimangrovi]
MMIDKQTSGGPVVAVLGGGFAGAATAYHLARALPSREARIVVVEPRPVLGRGLAYGSDDPAHRINVPAAKMSLIPDEPGHFVSWLTAEGIRMSPGTLTLSGDCFPERRIFGQYVAAQLGRFVASGVIRHRRAAAIRVARRDDGYDIDLSNGATFAADLVVLAMSHPAPRVPWALRGLTGSRRLIADPYDNARVAAIARSDRVLVVGSGLASADAVASLDRRGFHGHVTVLSRHGLRSRGHGTVVAPSPADFARPPERTAVGILGRVRAAVAADAMRGQSWHAALDRVREQGDAIWSALDPVERSRLARHLRRFWDVHRFRVAPQVEAVLARLNAAGRLDFAAARLIDATEEQEGVLARYRPRHATETLSARFDTVVIATGPDHAEAIPSSPVLRALAAGGLIEPDPLGLGLRVAGRCRAVARDGTASETLYVAGPLARGDVGELMGVPEVARHAERLAGLLAQRLTSLETPEATRSRRETRLSLWKQ